MSEKYPGPDTSEQPTDEAGDQENTADQPWVAWGEPWHGIQLATKGPGTRMDQLLPPERIQELGALCERTIDPEELEVFRSVMIPGN
jgi:hypothetical protein